MTVPDPYWYLASYPKSGNTWCRVFITELRRLTGLDSAEATAAAEEEEQGLRLNRDLATGSIVSSRHWLDDQLGIDSSDLSWPELDKVRGRVGHQRALYSECLRYHKVHDAGYVSVTKEILDRPQTSYAFTAKGRKQFEGYLSILEQILKVGRPGGDKDARQ